MLTLDDGVGLGGEELVRLSGAGGRGVRGQSPDDQGSAQQHAGQIEVMEWVLSGGKTGRGRCPSAPRPREHCTPRGRVRFRGNARLLDRPQKPRRRNPRHTLRPTRKPRPDLPAFPWNGRHCGHNADGSSREEPRVTRLVLGSRNKKKLREMVDLLGDLGLELTDLTPYPDAPEVEETADTFLGNATLKATQLAPVAQRLGDRRGQRAGRAGAGRRTGRLLRALRRHARRRRGQQREAAPRDGRAHGRRAGRVLRQHRGAGRPDGEGRRVGRRGAATG